MNLLGQERINTVIGKDVHGSDGNKIGTARQVFADDETGRPEWVTVTTGLFGTKESFIPLADASITGDQLTVPYDRDFVKDAPNVDEDAHLSADQERQLYAYYSRHDYGTGRDTGHRDRHHDRDTNHDRMSGGHREGSDPSGPTTDEAVTLSQERLDVGTERREAGRARLRKYVVTENVTETVPVQREEARLEREPINDGNRGAATSGPAISEEEHEVVLHEERAVVEKETVPVERVRLGTETVTEHQTVGDELRQERVVVDDDATPRDRPIADR